MKNTIVLIGLCSKFDGEETNDLVMPDGTLYDGKTRKVDKFSKSWR
jgi:hypothetical protein